MLLKCPEEVLYIYIYISLKTHIENLFDATIEDISSVNAFDVLKRSITNGLKDQS